MSKEKKIRIIERENVATGKKKYFVETFHQFLFIKLWVKEPTYVSGENKKYKEFDTQSAAEEYVKIVYGETTERVVKEMFSYA